MTYKVLSALLMIGLTAGCSKRPSAETNESSSSPDAPTPPSTATTAAPLSINIWTVYDTQQGAWNASFVETGTTTCSATTATPHATCTVQIPEGRLYFSKLFIQYNWLNQNNYCRLLHFQPYFYIFSTTSNAVVPPWATTPIDCTVSPLPATCFGGAAASGMVPNFPVNVSIIYPPDETQASGSTTASVSIPSANSVIYGSNRLTANDLPVALRGISVAPGAIHPTAGTVNPTSEPYKANTFVDYSFDCRDDWYDPTSYSISLNIQDQDSASGTEDDIATWKEAP